MLVQRADVYFYGGNFVWASGVCLVYPCNVGKPDTRAKSDDLFNSLQCRRRHKLINMVTLLPKGISPLQG